MISLCERERERERDYGQEVYAIILHDLFSPENFHEY